MKYHRPARTVNGKIGQGGRGALLEDLVNYTNTLYENRGIAMVQKIPTPITPIQMQGSRITLAFFAEKSTVDYIGIYQGRGLCFDAKECHTKTMPLKNIHPHQLKFMESFKRCGGYAFLIFYYTEIDRYYFMEYDEIKHFFDRMDQGGRKSIAFDELKEENFFDSGDVPVPYIEMLNKFKEENL